MKLTPRAKLLVLLALFLAPIVASFAAYYLLDLKPTANYGELLAPPASITTQRFARTDGGAFGFGDLSGKWIMVASDSGGCAAPCRDKLVVMRQVRLALGRNAQRVERVYVVDDLQAPAPDTLAPFPGMQVALTPKGIALPPGAANDRAHIYLVDPNGNVMMRWPAAPDARRMLKDLERLLKASQIG